jgi:hypothetical protein
MAQVKLLKIDSDGVSVEFSSTADDITLASYTVNGGPVLGTSLDMNGGDISDVDEISFTAPSTDGLVTTSGTLPADNIMGEIYENVMTTAGAILFPVITDSVDQVDAFRLPALAGVPTASPADGGEGYIVWDSTGDKMYAWDGAAWLDQSTATEALSVQNSYTAGAGGIAARDVVYISAADTVLKCDSSSGGIASRAMGLSVAAITAAASGDIQSEGVLAGFAGLTAGSRYFVDPATPGLITATRPVGAGNTVIQVGYAKSTTALHIHIEQLGRVAA